LKPKVLQAIHNQIFNISYIDFDQDKNLFFVGTKNGIIVTYELEHYNEKIIQQYQTLSNITFKKTLEIKTESNMIVTCVKYTNKHELLVSFSNGAIAVYSHDLTNPECMYIIY
jgi:hypothetical protein